MSRPRASALSTLLAVGIVVVGLFFGSPVAVAQTDDAPCAGTSGWEALGCNVGQGVRTVGNLLTSPGETIGGFASNVAGSAFEKGAANIWQSSGDLLHTVMSWWVKVPTPELYSNDADGLIDKVTSVTLPFQIFLACASVIGVSIRIAVARRQAAAAESDEAVKSLGRLMFTVALAPTVIIAGDRIATWSAQWMLDQAGGQRTILDRISDLMLAAMMANAGNPMFGFGFLLLFGMILFFSATLMAFFMLIRNAMLILVCAVLPIAAAASGFGTGKQTYQRLWAWTLAFLLFKPAGALVILCALWAGNSNDPVGILTGLILLVMAVFTLPALIRLLSPALASMGSGGTLAGAIAGGAVAGGAIPAMSSMLSSGSGSSNSSGGASNTPPSGARDVSSSGGSGSGPSPSPGGAGGPTPSGSSGAASSSSSGASGAQTSGTGASGAAAAGSGAAAAAVMAAQAIGKGAENLDSVAQGAAQEMNGER